MSSDPDAPEHFELPDGRRIAHATYGDPAGFPVLALHGTPGSRTKFALGDAAATTLGLRLIAVDRWGYGGSDVPDEPGLPRFAEDMVRLAEGLALDRLAILGVSGGGPYAVAAATGLGERIAALALVAPVGLIADAPDRGGLTPFHGFCFRVLPRLPGAVWLVFSAFRAGLAVAPSSAVRLVAARAGPSDRALVSRPEINGHLADCFRIGLATGVEGPSVDMAVFGRAWGVDAARVLAPARLWLGDRDRNVPLVAARHLASAISGCELVELPGQGHFWITRHAGEVLAWIAGHVGR